MEWSDITGKCGSCFRVIVADFSISKATSFSNNQPLTGNLTRFVRRGLEEITSIYRSHVPSSPAPEVPPHLPKRVLNPFLDAEKAFAQGIWSLAAAGYRKAVDRAITPLIGEAAQGKMLGPKIGMLERTQLLPPAMLEWIRIVKDDGNFALHDDDQDFDTREQVQPAREFAFTLLTYLYSLPEKVRLARGLTATEEEA